MDEHKGLYEFLIFLVFMEAMFAPIRGIVSEIIDAIKGKK